MKYLYGASGHAKVIVDVIKSIGEDISGIFDDDPMKGTFFNIPFLGKYNGDAKFLIGSEFLISIGDNRTRKFISKQIKQDFFSVCHNSSIIASSVKIGKGSVVMPSAVINANSLIGNHCIINTGAIIEHDCIIEKFVHIAPNATVTGNVLVGEGTFIGARTVIIPGVKVGKWVTIGAGSVIISDVPNYAVVVGNPGKIIRYNEK
ncbi:acetyltransferase [Aestuariivivens sp. NBU2969]|uniref:acetyltransferase n=1 Tax=Aestuariivivens sp. NBU2969 TaxID=2873267 RepID=UPI001CC0F719|nr:acetyltransferase [Aestuariivivens sp. NBU2969]